MTFSLVSRKFLGVRNIALYSVSSSKYLKDSKLIEGSYKLDEKSSMLMANGTNKHAVLAFSTQQAVSLLSYLLELVTSHPRRV